MLGNQKVDEVNVQGSQGKIVAPKGVSIWLKTDPNAWAWCIGRLHSLHTFAIHHWLSEGEIEPTNLYF